MILHKAGRVPSEDHVAFFFFFKILFIYMKEKERVQEWAEGQRETEK